MPTLAVAKKYLFHLLGKEYTQEDFDNLCFEFGVELDEVTSERMMFEAEQGKTTKKRTKDEEKAYKQLLDAKSPEEIYKIDTPANRYDILCPEGMAIALNVFRGTMPVPKFKVMPPQYTMCVKKSVISVRDYCVCAVLRGVTFNADRYASFIDFQEKLHSGLARKRTLVSVGTHDLDKVTPPFMYEAAPKNTIKFCPLKHAGVTLDCTGNGLTEFYSEKNDKHIAKFTPLISDKPNYPVIKDSTGTIMSLPPIINSDASAISLQTKNIFIECTALDHYKAHVLVNQMVSAFSWYCEEEFAVEGVNVEYESPVTVLGKTIEKEVTPNLALREWEVKVDHIRSRVGVADLTAESVAELLKKMMYETSVKDDNTVTVGVPVARSDVLHGCDIVEDVAIAYGYDNIPKVTCPTPSAGSQTPMNKLTHLLRLEVASAGYTEMLTFSLCSREEAFEHLGRVDKDVAVHIANPQTIEFQVVRPSLLPGTMKTLAQNKSTPLPLKLFEVTDVVLYDADNRIGCRNERHLCAVHAEVDSAAFQDIQGLAEYVMNKMGIPKGAIANNGNQYYLITQGTDKAFFEPLASQAIVLCTIGEDGKTTQQDIGCLGVIHPRTLKAFEYPFPASFMEINLEPFEKAPGSLA